MNNPTLLNSAPLPSRFNPNTGEIYPTYKPYNNNLAYKKSKAGEQLSIILNACFSSISQDGMQGSDIYLGINSLGSRYMIFGFEFIPFDSKKFKDKFLKHIITALRISDPSSNVINNCLTTIKETPECWNQDPYDWHNPSVRVVNHGYPFIYYFNNSNSYIQLTQAPNQNHCRIGVLNPPSSININTCAYTNFNSYQSLNSLKNDPKNNVLNLMALLDMLHFDDRQSLICMTWLIHSIISRNLFLLELINIEVSFIREVAEILKELIDPSSEKLIPIPKKANDIQRVGLNHYVMAFKSNSTKPLNSEQQNALHDLMGEDGAIVDITPSKKGDSKVFIRRPIILAAPDSLIDDLELRKKTVTIPISNEDSKTYIDLPSQLLSNARIELLKLCIMTSHVMSYESFKKPFFETNRFSRHESFIHLGCVISNLLNNDRGQKFIDQFESWALEDLFTQIEESDIAHILYKWAEEHKGKTQTLSISEWKHELNHFARLHEVNIALFSPRKMGSAFKKVAPILTKVGIKITSSGRRRYSSWEISVAEKIGLEGSIKIKSEATF